MQWLWRYRFRQTTLWLVAYIAFLAGIALAHHGWMYHGEMLLAAVTVFLIYGRKRTIFIIGLTVVIGGTIGLWRGSDYMHRLSVWQSYNFVPVHFTARALNDGVYGKHSQISFDASQVKMQNGQHLTGKVQVNGFGLNAVYQGDEVLVSGKLYPGYGAYQARLSFAKVTLLHHHVSFIAHVRRAFTAGMQSALPEPLAPFAMGLLVGQRATLPKDVKENLLMVGLTHIIAVSGYNLTIILQASRRLLGKRSKRISTTLTLGLIGVFLLITGASASIVRAAIVSVLSIAAGYYGRSFKPLNLISLAAIITVFANPYYLWGDLSWYLSFLAFFGVMVVAPLIAIRFPLRLRESIVCSVAIESISAEITTLPFVLYIFGQMSLVSLPANILVTSLIPLAMLLSFLAGLAGMFCAVLAGWVAWPATVLLNYMLDTARLLAGLPHIFREGIGFTLPMLISVYVLVIFMVVVLQKKNGKHDIITDREHQIY